MDCDLLESFLTEVGGGRHFSGGKESGKENAFSCCVLAGMRSMVERRVRGERVVCGGALALSCPMCV